jgi:lipoate-protein ligase A
VLAPRLLLAELGGGILDGLRFVGIHAVFGGKNDLLVAGRKIAGLGLYRDEQGALLFHASVLVDLDVETMLAALSIPAAKLGGASAAAVHERITTVRATVDRAVSTEVVRDAIAAGLARRHAVRLVEGCPTDAELTRRDELVRTRYADRTWLYRTAAAPAGTGSAGFRSAEGSVRVHVAAQRALATSVLFTGDFTAVPAGLRRLEAALRWRRLDARTVAGIVAEVRAEAEDDLGWDADADVVEAVLTAASRAIDREAAEPVRPQGSCYFPDPTESADAVVGATRGSSM